MKNPQNNRHIRVFISSTFRDMHEERDILIKKIFPELHKRCRNRGVEFTEIDLRWGVTEEQAERGEVLPICLKEIENSRPYFIGLLGERYGWVPLRENINPSIFQTQSWIEEHLDKSVTEMEIIHGVLKNPEMNDRAFFYFRDPNYLLKAKNIKINDFKESDKKLVEKLETLKNEIRNSNCNLKENYSSPEEVANYILDDLWKIIDEKFPADSVPDPLDKEIFEHEQFAQSRRKVYIGRDEYFNRLDDHSNSEQPPLIIIGESGSGKTALVANWVARYRERHPETFIIQHYVGSSVQSTNYISILKRIIQELKRKFNIKLEIPKEPEDVIREFPNWLSIAATNGKIILILDGLNQLEDIDNTHKLYWLPEIFPPKIRVITSILPGEVCDILTKRNWPVYSVTGLRSDERRLLISEYLWQYRKSLDEEQFQIILEKEQTQNPLYLKVLLDELRVFGVYEQLNDRIRHYIQAKSPAELYEKILERLEQDFEKDRPHLVQDALSLIWASRMGMSEKELLEILGEIHKPLPQAFWSPLFLALEESLVNRQGLQNFFHDYLRNAVYKKYIQNNINEKLIHEKIASYFEQTELDFRKIDELPWQLMKAEKWDKLAKVLQDLEFINEAFEKNEYEIKEYWTKTEQNTGLSPKDAYKKIINQPEKNNFYHTKLPSLLYDLGYNKEAYSLWNYLLSVLGDNSEYSYIMIRKMAHVLRDWGRLDEAMELYKKEEQICRNYGNTDGEQTSLHNQALILGMQGNVEEAFEQFGKGEQLAREEGDKYAMMVNLVNKSSILKGWGRYEEAMDLSFEAEKLSREIGNEEGLNIVLGNRALILTEWEQLEDALDLARQVEQNYRKLGDKRGLSSSLMVQARILNHWGKHNEALESYKKAEKQWKELGNKDELNKCIASQADILVDKGEFEDASRLYKKTELVFRELGNKDSLAVNLSGQASIFIELEKPDKALKLLKQAENIFSELGNKNQLRACWNNQVIILVNSGKLKEAEKLNQQVEQLCIELNNKDGMQSSLINQAAILINLEKTEEAFEKYKQAEQIASELKDKKGLQICKFNLALILTEWEQWKEAERFFLESEQICQELDNKSALIETLDSLANLHIKSEQKEKASDVYYQVEELCRDLENNLELQKMLAAHAPILGTLGKLEEAMTLFKEEEKLCRLFDNKDALSRNLSFQALILTISEKREEAIDVYKQEAELCRDLSKIDELLENFENQKNILDDLNRNEEVFEILKEEEILFRELDKQEKLAINLGNQGLVLSNLGQLEEAMKLHILSGQLFATLENKIGQSISLCNQALIYKEWGKFNQAIVLHEQEEKLCREANFKDGLQNSLGYQALLLFEMKEYKKALKLLDEQEEIAKQENIEIQEVFIEIKTKIEIELDKKHGK